MNNTFNIQRFGLLLKRQWLEFGKIYLISLAVALGVIVAFYGFSLWDQLFESDEFSPRDINFREPLFLIFGFIFISIIASSYFAHLGQKPKAIIDLLIPASTFEKFLAGIFYTAILSTASFLLLFYLTDLAFVSKLRSMFQSVEHVTSYIDRNGRTIETEDNLAYLFSKYDHIFKPLFAVPFFVTSIFLLGSVYFNKFHYIKTAISVMIFCGVWTAILYNLEESLFKGRIAIDETQRSQLNDMDPENWLVFLLVVLTLVFWSITYVRLKEKEV